MTADLHQDGLRNILTAIDVALAERHVEGAHVAHETLGGATLNVIITVGDKSGTASFAAAEIADCGQAIDAPAAFKVRLLVSQFVR